MGFATSLALSVDSPTDVDTNTSTYVQQFADENRSRFSVSGQTPPTEFLLTIQHDVEKDGTKRHVLRLDDTRADAQGVAAQGSAYIVLRQPVNSAFTEAVMLTLVYRLVDALIEGGSGANVSKLLNGEV
jgi:hypothetical protein